MNHKNVSGVGVKSLNEFLKDNPSFRAYDFSQLGQWNQCNRKFSYKYREGLLDDGSQAALFSKHIIHPVVSRYYAAITANPDAIFPVDFESYKDLWQEYDLAWQNSPTPIITASAKTQGAYTGDALVFILSKINKQLQNDRGILRLRDAETVYWRVVNEVENAVWLAKPDLCLTRGENQLITVDTKLSAYDFHSNLSEFDRQFLGQSYAASSDYIMKLFIHVTLDSRGTCKGVNINRSIMQPDQDQLREFKDEMVQTIKQIQASDASDVWPKNAPRACFDFNRACKFVDLCSLASGWNTMAAQMQRTDNPLHYLED